MIGVQGQDLEEVLLIQNPRFWELIESRRKQPTLSLAEVRKRLGQPSKRKRLGTTVGAQCAPQFWGRCPPDPGIATPEA